MSIIRFSKLENGLTLEALSSPIEACLHLTRMDSFRRAALRQSQASLKAG